MYLPDKLISKIGRGKILWEERGQSPARIYRVEGEKATRYLKISSPDLDATTYSVRREEKAMRWLSGRVRVPQVTGYAEDANGRYLLMERLPGTPFMEEGWKEEELISFLSNCLRQLWRIEIRDCPVDASLDYRLWELGYLLERGYADVDCCDWEQQKDFHSPQEVYRWLRLHMPPEDRVFTHGDLCGGNLMLDPHGSTGFIDLGRAGAADRWVDIAFCADCLWEAFGKKETLEHFFVRIGVKPDWDKLFYYHWLNELF